jgi:hypothetical protein
MIGHESNIAVHNTVVVIKFCLHNIQFIHSLYLRPALPFALSLQGA